MVVTLLISCFVVGLAAGRFLALPGFAIIVAILAATSATIAGVSGSGIWAALGVGLLSASCSQAGYFIAILLRLLKRSAPKP
jgi:hypothetical protein